MNVSMFHQLDSRGCTATSGGRDLDQLATIAWKALVGAARTFDPDCGVDFVDHANQVIPHRIRVLDVPAGGGWQRP